MFDAYIYVSDVDQLANELRAKNADIIEGRLTEFTTCASWDCNGCLPSVRDEPDASIVCRYTTGRMSEK